MQELGSAYLINLDFEIVPLTCDVRDDDKFAHIAHRVNTVSRWDWSMWAQDTSGRDIVPSWAVSAA